ncbi:hypothetical protein EDC01DRAFT_681953 [Geopyxis carbonaria]|nr:hypothetical protein EDC01DRAFT_681953 [Geopyxis carbonaria]
MNSDSSVTGDIKATSSGVENVVYSKPTKRARAGRHCRKWWWAWLLGFCVFVVVIVVIIVYAIIPAVAQKKINETELEVHSFEIRDPTPESFVVSLNATITGGGGIASNAHLDAMDVVLFIEGHDPIQPIMTLPVDAIDGGDSIPVIRKDYKVEIKNEGALDEFSKLLMDSETFRVAMRGRTKLSLGSIHTHIDYNEVVTLKGLNHLEGMIIKSYELLLEDDFNMGGQVLIPNPSVFSVQMGDVNLAIALGEETLGTGVIPNLILTPGNNEYAFKANIEQLKLLKLASAARAGKSLTIGSNGTTINNEQIPWLSKPLQILDTLVPVETA